MDLPQELNTLYPEDEIPPCGRLEKSSIKFRELIYNAIKNKEG